ncbi:PilW family protein [Dyella humicola]|uniref:PilW family protein n=1 Tax=Dyella humicola TaxID=2992126 RepID=UPI002259B9F2|nr:PilW family protein [Dyella humicola]
MIARRPTRRSSGFSLIELMIAMVLGLLVAAGIVSIFISTSSSNRVQTQLARLQEQGRYAITRISSDIAAANGQYCNNSAGDATLGTGGVYVDGLRAPMVYVTGTTLTNAMSDVTTKWGTGGYPASPTAALGAYVMPSFLSMRGYDCPATGTCTPVDPSSSTTIPAGNITAGSRVVGTSVLTMRFINPGSGWTIYPSGSTTGTTMTTSSVTSGASITQINLKAAAGEPPIANIKANDLMLVSNCSTGQIFAVSGQGSPILAPLPVGTNFALPQGQQGAAAPMLFDLNTDFQTVTYYLQVVDNHDGTTTGALMRRVNGAFPGDEIVRGIERLDFKYGVEYPDGTTQFLDAATVDASNSTTTGCISGMKHTIDTVDQGCLWRAVKSIRVDLLMNGQVPLYTLTADEMQYTYQTDGITAPAAPGDARRKVTPAQQNFVNQLLRREFTALISLRNFNS